MSQRKAKVARNLALSLLFTGTGAAVTSLVPPAAYAAITGNVTGVVRGADGQPLQGARVLLIGVGTPPRAITDKSGYYSFNGVTPGPYKVQVSLSTYETATVSVSVVQDITQTVDFSLNKAILRKNGTFFVSPVRRGDPSQTTTISRVDEQREKSQPNNLYQSTGLLNYKPGVTVDSGQYPHLRGSAQNQIDYMVDGISVRDPIFNQFQTNIVTVGVQTSNVQTAGQDASYGGATGGYLNQITSNGRDLRGGTIETTFGPAHLWRYKGNRFEYGNITPDNKFDYAVSNINFQSYFGANTQLGKLNSSTDSQIKLNYYGDGGNTITLYGHHGAEDYWTYDATNPNFNSGLGVSNGSTYKFGFGNVVTGTDPNGKTVTYAQGVDTKQYQLGHTLQTDNEVYGQIRHNFTTSSYLQYKSFDLHQHSPTHTENINADFLDFYATKKGNQLDYYNQVDRNIALRAGYLNLNTGGSHYRTIVSYGGFLGPLDAQPRPYYSDRTYGATPLENDLYLSTTYKTNDSKVAADLGVRYGDSKYRLQTSATQAALFPQIADQTAPPKSYSAHYVDPRIGATYSPDRLTVIRSSYAVNSQMPESRYVQFTNPLETGILGTAIDPLAQFKAGHGGRLGFNRLGAYHSNDFDLGIERAFKFSGLVGGSYSASLTGYQKKQYDIPQLDQPSFDYPDFPTITINGAKVNSQRLGYVSTGHGHASGFEFAFRKIQVHPSDWSGYLSYTNQVVRANTDSSDTGYAPYFYNSLKGQSGFFDSRSGNPNNLPASQDFRRLNNIEFPTGYDQRHTVAIVANKSFFKFIDSSFVVDAGSGYPFFTGATVADGGFGAADSFHGELSQTLKAGGNADFTEVPFIGGVSGGSHANPIGVVAGQSSWHYKIGINTTFHLTPSTNLFLNVDNVFDKKTITNFAPATFSGQPYYVAPTAQFPQGKIVYGAQTILTPIFLTFGFQQKF